ncbi:MAG: Crp/Fnr family transcriptional regulator [Clostridia bacterium]|nr:Crp/Fnr family transcriptional regulator [Clostridia bacterium]
MKDLENGIINNLFLFNGVPGAVKLIDTKSIKSYKKGDTVYNSEEYEKAIGIVISGKLTALPINSDNAMLKTFNKGDVFGAAAVFGESENYISRIYANTNCKVLFISEEVLKKLFAKYPAVAENYIKFLSAKIRFLNKKISLFTADGVESKVYAYLIENGNCQTINYSSMARTLSIGRTSLYRALQNLESKKLIIKNEKGIEIL